MKLVLSFLLTLGLLFVGCRAMGKISGSLSQADRSMTKNAPLATPATAVGSADSVENGRYVQLAARNQQGQAGQLGQEAQQPSASLPPAAVIVATDRKIIRNGEFTIESKTPTEDQRKIEAIAEFFGGFVVTSEFQQSDSSVSTVKVTVRVPAAQFQAATDKILAVGTQVLHKKIDGKDVTEEYVDLEAQLRAKKALEAQFLEIMKQARKVEEALSVQEKLSEVRTEIERLEGRRRYLENQAALSTVNVTLQTPAPLIAASQTGFWASVKSSFGDGVDEAVSIVLGLIHFVIVLLPVFVLILLPGGLLLRYCWKRLGWQRLFRKAAVTPQSES